MYAGLNTKDDRGDTSTDAGEARVRRKSMVDYRLLLADVAFI